MRNVCVERYQRTNWEAGAGPTRADSVFGGGRPRWGSYLHPPVSAGWRDGGPARPPLPARPQNGMGAFVVRIQPPHSIATLATHASLSKCLLFFCFLFCL